MLRKFLNIIVLSWFVISTTGFSISRHYCHGELVSVALNAKAESCCDSNSCGCCHDEMQFYQLDEHFTASQHLIIEKQISVAELLLLPDLNTGFTNYKPDEIILSDHGPPFIDRQFLYYTHRLKLAPPVC